METELNVYAQRLAAAWSDAMVRIYEVTPNGRVTVWNDALALVTDTDFASLNLAVGRTPGVGPESLASLRSAAAEVGRSGLPWSIVVRGPVTGPVADLAAEFGLTERAGLPLMACAVGEAVLRADHEQSSSIRAVDASAHDVYTEALAAGFEAPEQMFGTLMGGGVLDLPETTGYLAGPEDRPTATGFLVRGTGVCQLLNIAVVPEARGHGLGRAMTARAMADGFAAGADTAMLISSAAGQAMYESMGFRLVEVWTSFTAG